MLIELFAQIAHLNNLRLDFIANEQSWVNAEQPQTILNFLPLMDFKLRSVTGSTTTIYAQVSNQAGNISQTQILIPARTELTATNLEGSTSVLELLASPTNYTADILLSPNQRTYTLTGYAGRTEFVEIQVSKPENFTFKINQRNVIDGSIQIFERDDEIFTLLEGVESFLVPLTGLPQYTVRFDFEGRPTVIFGNRFFGGKFDGITSNNPASYKTLRIYYRYLEDDTGSVTNYAPGAIEQTLSFYSNIINDNINLTFFNQLAGTGGSDILKLNEVRQIAPLTLRTADKAVTNEDYEIFISQDTLVKDVIAITPIEEPSFNIPIFHAHIYVSPNRLNSSFIPSTTVVQDYQMPDVLPGETQDDYLVRFYESLNNFYNIRGLETKARLTGTVTGITSETTFPIILNVNDRMRIIVDSDDLENDYVDIKFTENSNKSITDIISEINENFEYPVASIKDGRIVLESSVIGTGSYIQLLGNSEDPVDNDIINETYISLGFQLNIYDQGLDQSQEAESLYSLISDKKISGIEPVFRPIITTPFNVRARIFYNVNSNPEVLRTNIKEALYNEFSYQSSYLSKSIHSSKIGNIINNVSGVEFTELIDFPLSVEASLNQIYFILDEVIIQKLPNEFPDLEDMFKVDLTMIRSNS